MAARAAAARTRTINIRIEEERRTLIDRAAEAAGKDRLSSFWMQQPVKRQLYLDERYFQLDRMRSRSSTLPWMRLPPRTRVYGSVSLEKRPGSDE